MQDLIELGLKAGLTLIVIVAVGWISDWHLPMTGLNQDRHIRAHELVVGDHESRITKLEEQMKALMQK